MYVCKENTTALPVFLLIIAGSVVLSVVLFYITVFAAKILKTISAKITDKS